jgi:UDP-N-acetylglucosamine:LPS N-acetylglucosamine transferase
MGETRPDVVVSVLPVVNGLLAELSKDVEVVLTDWHSVHRFWVAQGVGHYTAPTASARQDCIRFGASALAVDVVGIPVRGAFTEAALQQPQKHQQFTLLMMVGAEGSPRAVENLRELAQLDLDAQIVVVCGRNEQLRQQVEALPARLNVKALGFVEDIATLMRSADILVTKAGGLTLAEAFCCGVPVVVYDVLPGQEAGNLDYALSQSAVAHSSSPRQLAEIVRQLDADSSRRAALASSGRRLVRPDAATQIVANILERRSGAACA